MKKHYATHVEDTDKLISVAGPILEYETWYEQYKKLNDMRFIEIPVEVYDLIPEEIKKQMSIDSPRYNVYNTKIIMHLTHYETLFPSDMKIDGEEITEPTYPFPVYTSPSLEFSNLLASEEWSSNEEEYDI